jgi:hypothetical protein
LDQRLAKWIRWFEEIRNDVQKLLINRHIFSEVQKIVAKNKRIHKPSSFYQYMAETYVAYITVGIRRQLKYNKDSISFVRLLSEIRDTPAILSRTYYKSLYKGSPVENHADRHFDNIAGGTGNHISVQMVTHDLAKLKRVASRIEEFADRRIAHRDDRKPQVIPTFLDVDKSLSVLDMICCRYQRIFFAEGSTTLMPTFQFDWTEIFRKPWIP